MSDNIIRFPSDNVGPREALEEALKEVDSMKGVVILSISNAANEKQEISSIRVGSDHEFNDKDVLWMIKRLEFLMMEAAISLEEEINE